MCHHCKWTHLIAKNLKEVIARTFIKKMSVKDGAYFC